MLKFFFYLYISPFFLIFIKNAELYSTGAGMESCLKSEPVHKYPSQISDSPYEIIVEKYYRYDTPLRVLIRTKGFESPFAGFFTQIRENRDGKEASEKSSILGEWSLPPEAPYAKTMHCFGSNDSITHTNSAPKREALLLWNPPEKKINYPIYVLCTVLQDFHIFWLIRSYDILLYNSTANLDQGMPFEYLETYVNITNITSLTSSLNENGTKISPLMSPETAFHTVHKKVVSVIKVLAEAIEEKTIEKNIGPQISKRTYFFTCLTILLLTKMLC